MLFPDAVVGGVAATIVVLDIIFGVVRIVDACQTVVVVAKGYHLSFFSHVRRLLVRTLSSGS